MTKNYNTQNTKKNYNALIYYKYNIISYLFPIYNKKIYLYL